jgi:hypothetical protein
MPPIAPPAGEIDITTVLPSGDHARICTCSDGRSASHSPEKSHSWELQVRLLGHALSYVRECSVCIL